MAYQFVQRVQMPRFGLNTEYLHCTADQEIKAGLPAYDTMKAAIRMGYKYLVTASVYQNEVLVGTVINDCISEGICTREDLFIALELWTDAGNSDAIIQACRFSLAKLNLKYVDMFLLHWPVPQTGTPCDRDEDLFMRCLRNVWIGMEDCRRAGLTKNTGVRDFSQEQCEKLMTIGYRMPEFNQVDIYPYTVRLALREQSNSESTMILIFNCALRAIDPNEMSEHAPTVLRKDEVKQMARRYKRTPPQMLFRFHMEHSCTAMAKSEDLHQLERYYRLFNFQLTEADVTRLRELYRYAMEDPILDFDIDSEEEEEAGDQEMPQQ